MILEAYFEFSAVIIDWTWARSDLGLNASSMMDWRTSSKITSAKRDREALDLMLHTLIWIRASTDERNWCWNGSYYNFDWARWILNRMLLHLRMENGRIWSLSTVELLSCRSQTDGWDCFQLRLFAFSAEPQDGVLSFFKSCQIAKLLVLWTSDSTTINFSPNSCDRNWGQVKKNHRNKSAGSLLDWITSPSFKVFMPAISTDEASWLNPRLVNWDYWFPQLVFCEDLKE